MFSLSSSGAVVGHQVQVVGGLPELVLQNDDVLGAEADDHVHNGAGFLEALGGRQSDGAAYAAADHADPLLALHVGGLAQRADKVPDVIAFIQGAQGFGGEANLLEDNGHGAFFPVTAGDGQGYALAQLVDPDDDELTCLGLAGDEGGLNVHHGNGGVQFLFPYNFIHVLIRPFQNIYGCEGKMPIVFIIRCLVYFVKYESSVL